jgi:perosamine synthetase
MKRNFLVTASPTPSFGNILKGPGPFSAHLKTFTGLHDLGRSAIYWACRGLGLDPGTQIWMPALHCGVDAQAAIDAGLEVGFYRLSNDLAIDEADLQAKLCDRPGVVFIIHYFGFAQPAIERIAGDCRRLGCVVIEDCAHALFSKHCGRELGDFAPIAVFSLHKTLPIPDGGALKVNAELLRQVTEKPFSPPPPGEFSLETLFGYPKSAARALLGPRVAGVYRHLRSRGADEQYRPPNPVANFQPKTTRPYALAMSALSRRVAASPEPARIVERRRLNYSALDQALAGSPGYRKIFDRLPEHACPLFLPIWVADRETLMTALRRRGVETFRFGAAPHPELDAELRVEATPLRDNILCLPVHDQITDGDIEEMARIVRPLLARHALPLAVKVSA